MNASEVRSLLNLNTLKICKIFSDFKFRLANSYVLFQKHWENIHFKNRKLSTYNIESKNP